MRRLRLILTLVAIATSSCSYVERPYYGRGTEEILPWAEEDVDHRLFLLGDAGDPLPDGEPTLQTLAAQIRRIPHRTTAVFLGDNVYERGMPEKPKPAPVDAAAEVASAILPGAFDSRREAERSLNAQIDVVRDSGARGIFIPGNHDWDFFELGGWQRIIALGDYLAEARHNGVNVALHPRGGCPGPVAIPLGNRGVLVAVDTQWWLETRLDGKPTPDNNPTHCKYTTESAVRDAMLAEIRKADAAGRRVIVAGHHPVESMGPHGGFVDFRTHLFPFLIVEDYVPFYLRWLPLPVIGSLIVQLRACCSPSAQDMSNRRYHHMRANVMQPMIAAAREGHAPLLYASGHDHSLQLFKGRRGPGFTAVSGIGSSSKASSVGKNRRTMFAHSNTERPGFMMVDFHRDGRVRLSVIERTEKAPEGEEVYATLLTPARSAGDAP